MLPVTITGIKRITGKRNINQSFSMGFISVQRVTGIYFQYSKRIALSTNHNYLEE